MDKLTASVLPVLFSVVLLVSCEENPLQETPKDFISNSNYWQSEEDAIAAIRGVYSALPGRGFTDQAVILHAEYANGRGSWEPINNYDRSLDPTHIGRTGGVWNWDYQMINRANNVLANVPGIEGMDETLKAQIIAEAYCMRAWAYFELVRAYGPVPLRTSPTTDVGGIAAPRAPVDEVYNQIIQDLQAAEPDLPVSVGDNTGRASRAVAKMLLAQVYLTRENWSEAAEKAEEVINMSGEYSLVEVEEPEDFYSIFATPANPEDIMSIHFASNREDPIVLTLHRANIPAYNSGSTGFFTSLPETNSIIGDSWDNEDLRKSFNLYREYVNAEGDTVSLPSTTPVLFKKYIAQPDGIRSNSRPLFRYTEAFLIYAEAAAMAAGSPTPLALERLNIIKRRAYGYDPFSPSPVDYSSGMSLEAFRDTMLRERAYEFLLEQRRWWDLKRTGRVAETIETTGKEFNDVRLLFPIPEDEINNNDEINQEDQNPGY